MESFTDLPDNTLLFTMDVKSLYTNIPNQEGLRAVAKALSDDPDLPIPARCILQCLKFALEKNNFEFNDQHYQQVGGTAMGMRAAPSFANIYMGEFEQKALQGYHLSPEEWCRFIDDIFGLWTHGEEELLKFQTYLNSITPSIELTLEYSDTKVSFLDTLVHFDKATGKLHTSLYTKPTDTHSYLQFTSAHPFSVKKAGPYGQFLRLRRLCTKEEDFTKHCEDMTSHYTKRGYPPELIHDSRVKAAKVTHHRAVHGFSKTNTNTNNPLVFVTTYNQNGPNIKDILAKHWDILQRPTISKEAFPDPPLVGKRRNSNLKDII
jgi:hypothetical protein